MTDQTKTQETTRQKGVRAALREVCAICGSQAELARQLGVSPVSINRWLNWGRVPAKWVVTMERITGGEVSRERLCPELFVPPVGQSAWRPKPTSHRKTGNRASTGVDASPRSKSA